MEFTTSKYGILDGNYKEFMRIGRTQDDGEVIVELKFRKIKLMAFPNRLRFKREKPWFIYMPGSDSIKDLEVKVKRLIASYYYNVRKDTTIILTKFRLWKCKTDEI